ncbi:MAG: aquaporin [Nocardioides sp.]
MSVEPWRRALAEGLGTGCLVAAVVGSGIMATRLSEDVGIQLLLNALATVSALAVLITVLGPVSGAHFNPAVTLVAAVSGRLGSRDVLGYLAAQFGGGCAGAVVANAMFGMPAVFLSGHDRTGPGQWTGEIVATAGLVGLIEVLTRTKRGHLGAVLVPLWIGAAYLFTVSTSFANPAVTVARVFSDTFAGIAPSSMPGFVVAQLAGAALGFWTARVLFPDRDRTRTPTSDLHPVGTPGTPDEAG